MKRTKACSAPANPVPGSPLLSRRTFLSTTTALACAAHTSWLHGATPTATEPVNLARVAVPSSQKATSENRIGALNDEAIPRNSADREAGTFALRGTPADAAGNWVQYAWSKPVAIDRVDLYWAIDPPRPDAPPGSGFVPMSAPSSYRILFWNGQDFEPVREPAGYGNHADTFNSTSFQPVVTDRLRLEVTNQQHAGTGILEWRVFSAGPPPLLAPVVHAGLDRSVVLGGRTYLAGSAMFLQARPGNAVRWSKVSGPGEVRFAQAAVAVTTASFSAPGEYVLKLTGRGVGQSADSVLHVQAEPAPPKDRLQVVYTRRYSIDSPLWNARAKSLVVDWIPHCIAYCERTDIQKNKGDGGLDNFIEAGKANRGEPHGRHLGFVFSNAWVHQTVEAMCIALMIDPGAMRP